MRTPPSYFKALAEQAEREGRWSDAALEWEAARCASLSSTCRAAYAERAAYCRTQAKDNAPARED